LALVPTVALTGLIFNVALAIYKPAEGFQSHEPEDAQVIAATAWASLTAARRVGTWLQGPTPEARAVQGRAAHAQPEHEIC
jgi:hypothetical protein